MNPQLLAACQELATAWNHFNWATTTEEIVLACHEIETAKARIGLIVKCEEDKPCTTP
jgi:exosortase/archaeosortase